MPGKLNEQHVRKTAIQLALPAEFVRKDYFVTKAIRILTNVEDKYFKLIFQGGTSLSKGYQVIHRLSEDADFRIMQKSACRKIGKEARRKKLREFRYALVKALTNNEFKISNEDIKVFYEGRFMSIRAAFQDSEKLPYLKPHVAIEYFVGELALDPQVKNISSLIKTTLGKECDHTYFPVYCVSLDETAAEKWVALTRRIAGTLIKERQSDKHLVRHLYDLSQLANKDLLSGNYRLIVKKIILKDSKLFGKHNLAYTKDPICTSMSALRRLATDSCWQDHWDFFLQQMVYDGNKPTFKQALNRIEELSNEIFSQLSKDY